jgi:hypothetical protein
MQKFNDEIKDANLTEKINLVTDPNKNYNIILRVIEEAKYKHLPTRTVKFNKRKHKKTKWITFGLIKSINHRDTMYKKLKLTNPDSPEFIIKKANLKSYNSILKRSIRLQKKLYYGACFKKFKNDMKRKWQTISEVLCKTNKKENLP